MKHLKLRSKLNLPWFIPAMRKYRKLKLGMPFYKKLVHAILFEQVSLQYIV